MKTNVKIISFVIVSFMMLFVIAVSCQRQSAPVRVLLITGGHDYDDSLEEFINSLPDIVVAHVKHPDALLMFRPENRALYDVVLLYDMNGSISDSEKKDFIDCFAEGKGLVVWHHAYASYQDWSEYKKIIGGRYYYTEWTDSEGVSHPPSTYEHDMNFRVRIKDRNHPIVEGIDDFDIIDETYGSCCVNPEVNVLLTTDEATSVPSIAWTNRYGKSNVVTLLLGHDEQAWNNPNFKKLLTQAIKWTISN